MNTYTQAAPSALSPEDGNTNASKCIFNAIRRPSLFCMPFLTMKMTESAKHRSTILHHRRFQQRISLINIKVDASQGQMTYTYFLKVLG